jgi:Flp pilus assembly CpaE family ATPase
MYPFSILMVNCDATRQNELMGVLRRLQACVLKSIPKLQLAFSECRPAGNEPVAIVGCFDSAEDVQAIRQFRRLQPAWPVIAIVPQSQLVGAMRAGATQVVAAPVQEADFHEALLAVAEQFALSRRPSQIVTVTGATSGCGATLIAAILAAELAQLDNRHVILAEPTVPRGQLAARLAVKPDCTVVDLLRPADAARTDSYKLDPTTIRRALVPVGERLELLASEYRSSMPTSLLPPAGVLELVSALRTMADVVVLEVPCTYDDLFFTLLSRAEQVVLVGEQRIPAIRTMQMITEILSQAEGERQVHVLLNRYDPTLLGFTVEKLHELVPADTIQPLPNDPAVGGAGNSGLLLSPAAANTGLSHPHAAANAPLLLALRSFAQRLTQDKPTAPEPRQAFLTRLARMIGFSL